MKICFKCGESKGLDSFYKHPQMADGYLNKCKDCAKKDVKENRNLRHDYYIEYDRNRFNVEKRKKAREAYAKTKTGVDVQRKARRKYLQNHPLKRSTHIIFGNALRDGRVKPLPCEICGNENVEGHHFDYSKPLDVVWLCTKHHAEYHKQERRMQEKMAKQTPTTNPF